VLDPDAIARTLQPAAPHQAAAQAGREALRRQRVYLADQRSFAVETTLSGSSILRLMEDARGRGFIV
jgi:predicted ABC-type ATPase